MPGRAGGTTVVGVWLAAAGLDMRGGLTPLIVCSREAPFQRLAEGKACWPVWVLAADQLA